MQGEKRDGRYRIIQDNKANFIAKLRSWRKPRIITVRFFNVWFSDIESDFVICELKFSEDGLNQSIDKSTNVYLRTLCGQGW